MMFGLKSRQGRAAAILLLALTVTAASTQTNANWPLADRFTTENLRPYVYSMSVAPGWINKTSQFWYTWRDSSGVKFYRVDPAAKKKTPLFDSAKMAALLSEAVKKPYDVTNLPITTVTFDEKDAKIIRFTVERTRFEYNTEKEELKNLGRATGPAAGAPGAGPGGGQGGNRGGGGGQGQGGGNALNRDFRNYSPDRKAYVYAQDHNLFYVAVVDDKPQEPVQLTKDGEKDYSFGSRAAQEEIRQQFQQQQQQQTEGEENQGQQQTNPNEQRVRANVTWSKDSKRFYVTRSDSRKVKDLYLVNNLSEPRPTLMTYKYAMPGEADVTQMELFAFDPDKKELKKLPVEKWKDQRMMNLHFQDTTSDTLRFVRRDRLQRNLEFCEIDLKTNKITPMITESIENAYLESQNVRYLKPGGDFIWWSERTGWGHLYLYDNAGKLKNVITSGPYRADSVVEVDAEKNKVYFTSYGREENENPYYRHLYRIGLDGKDLTLLDPGDADHSSTLSTDKKYVVDVASRTDMEPRACVRDEKGNVVMELEKADLSRLGETGWRMPETFKVKAADGVTDIYGNMWKPFDFDKNKKYPIIANVYPGPQTESVSAAFSAMATNQRLAQLGFIVIQIGNRGGNPARSNAYHSYGYYNLRDYGLADKKAGIEQLAARFPWIDVDKVGIYGHSGGGFMTAAALMLPPYNDFFKVGVSSAGNHDNNVYNQNWSEQHHGLREVAAGATTTGGTTGAGRGGARGGTMPEELYDLYDQGFPDQEPQSATTKFDIKVPTNAELAPNLKGHLFLVHGDMDNNVHHAGTMRLVNALIKANKRFDLLLLPGQAHGFGTMTPYFTQRMYEYFAEHLLGDTSRKGADMTIKN